MGTTKNIVKPSKSVRRPRYPMPDHLYNAIKDSGLLKQYEDRPPYQKNDYIGWINRAVLEATKQKRLKQMLDELKKGDVYMKMAYRPKKTR